MNRKKSRKNRVPIFSANVRDLVVGDQVVMVGKDTYLQGYIGTVDIVIDRTKIYVLIEKVGVIVYSEHQLMLIEPTF